MCDKGICVWANLVSLLLPWVHVKNVQRRMSAGKKSGVHDLQLLPKKPATALEPKQRHGLHQELCRGYRSLATWCHIGCVCGRCARHFAFLQVLSCRPRPSPYPHAIWDTHVTPPPSWDLWAPSSVGLISSHSPMRSGWLVTRMGRREGQSWHSTVLDGLASLQPSQGDSGMWGTPRDALLCSAYPVVWLKLCHSCGQHDQQSCMMDLHPSFA